MEAFGNPPLNAVPDAVMKKPRSVASRKPRPKDQLASEYRDLSCMSSRSNSRSISPDENMGVEGMVRRKELYLNTPPVRSSSANRADGHGSSKKIRREDRVGGEHDGHNRSSKSRGGSGSDGKCSNEGVLALASWRSMDSPDSYAERNGSSRDMYPPAGDPNMSAENKLRKVKLKLGGVTRTIHAKTNSEMGDGGASSFADASLYRQKHKGDHWRDSSGLKYYHDTKEGNHVGLTEGSLAGKHGDRHHSMPSSEPVRKSKRVPKRRMLDGDFDDNEDGELRYLEKLKVSKFALDHPTVYEDAMEDGVKKRKISKISRNRSTLYELDEVFIVSRSGRDSRKRSRSGDGTDIVEEEELGSESGLEVKKKKQKEVDSPSEVRTEPLTTRQRALQGKGGNGESLIEFPDGLPAAPSRKQKEKLSEVEIQAKKAEAAQRRKMQVEKAAREAEAEAIRKILGLDSDKKKEEKKQKEREEKEKAAKSQMYTGNTIRWVMGQSGTVVTFPNDVGLPSIFNPKPFSYPPPREKCAGPSCTNPYKYRDSKSKLPLCSLECYRAVQGSAQTLTC